MQQTPSIPLVQYTKVFGAASEKQAKSNLIGFERSLCTMDNRYHNKLSSQVIAYLLLAPRHRDIAHNLLQRQTRITSIHMVVTNTHALFLVNGVAWTMTTFGTNKMTCVGYHAHEKLEIKELLCDVSDFASCLAHAMALADILPQAVLLVFPSMHAALECQTLRHLPSNFLVWARGSSLKQFCPSPVTPPPTPTPTPASANTKTTKTTMAKKQYKVTAGSSRREQAFEQQKRKKSRLSNSRQFTGEIIKRELNNNNNHNVKPLADFIELGVVPRVDPDCMSTMELLSYFHQRENAVARRNLV